MTARTRAIVDEASIPSLPGHVRLQYCTIREAWAVLAPERVYWPDATSLDILRRCNGQDDARRISQSLAEDYDAPLETIKPDVLDFLQEWSDTLLIRCVQPGGARAGS